LEKPGTPNHGYPKLTTELLSVGWKPGCHPNMDHTTKSSKAKKTSWDFPFQQPHVVIPTPCTYSLFYIFLMFSFFKQGALGLSAKRRRGYFFWGTKI